MITLKSYRKGKPRGNKFWLKESESDFRYFYLKEARDYEDEMMCKTYDLLQDEKWCGFISVANHLLRLDPKRGLGDFLARKGIPREPPGILLAQLYVKNSHQNQGIGGEALWGVINKIALRSSSGCRLVIIDVANNDKKLRKYYKERGWIPAPYQSSRLYLDLRMYKLITRAIRRIKPNIKPTEELKQFAIIQDKLLKEQHPTLI